MSDRDDVERLAREWAQAVKDRDMEKLERLLAPEYTFTTAHRGRLSRREWLETTKNRYVVEEFAFDEIDVDVFEDTAVVLSRYRQRNTMDGADRNWTYLMSDVWIRRGGSWQAVARHASPVENTPDG